MTNPLILAVALVGGAIVLGVLSFRIRQRLFRLVMRIAAAWLLAIALLAGAIPLIITTPGYRNDHME